MKKKKALFVSYDGLSDPLGQSQIIPYYLGLAKLGHDISILSCEKPEALSDQVKAGIEEQLSKGNIQWNYVMYTKQPPIFSTFIDLLKMKKLALSLHQDKGFDIVHCRTILSTKVGFALQKKGAKFLFDIRGFWTEERVDGKLWNLKNPIYNIVYRYFKFWEKKAFKKANHIITLTENAKREVQNNFDLSANTISVVPCTADLEHFNPKSIDQAQVNENRSKYGLERAGPIFCYSGSLGTRYMIEEMLQFFSQCLDKYPNAQLLVITKSDTEQLQTIASSLNIDQQVKTCATNYQNIPNYLTIADLGLYFIFAGNSGKAVSPTKQAEFLGLGIPIISNSGIGDTEAILSKENAGIIVQEFNKSNYTAAIEEIPALLKTSPEELIQVAKKYFALPDGINTYHKVYQSL